METSGLSRGLSTRARRGSVYGADRYGADAYTPLSTDSGAGMRPSSHGSTGRGRTSSLPGGQSAPGMYATTNAQHARSTPRQPPYMAPERRLPSPVPTSQQYQSLAAFAPVTADADGLSLASHFGTHVPRRSSTTTLPPIAAIVASNGGSADRAEPSRRSHPSGSGPSPTGDPLRRFTDAEPAPAPHRAPSPSTAAYYQQSQHRQNAYQPSANGAGVPSNSARGQQQRRERTFAPRHQCTPQQEEILRREFVARGNYIDRNAAEELSQQLGMRTESIMRWFANRRAEATRQHRERAREAAGVSHMTDAELSAYFARNADALERR